MLVACLTGISAACSAMLKLDDDSFDGFVGSLQDDALLLVDFFRVSSCAMITGLPLDFKGSLVPREFGAHRDKRSAVGGVRPSEGAHESWPAIIECYLRSETWL